MKINDEVRCIANYFQGRRLDLTIGKSYKIIDKTEYDGFCKYWVILDDQGLQYFWSNGPYREFLLSVKEERKIKLNKLSYETR